MADEGGKAADERWLASTWPFIREYLPALPARILEIGCGPLGGFVPAMRSDGYDAFGIDPHAPDEPGYEQTEFESFAVTKPAEAVVACLSLHHVTDLGDVLDRIALTLAPTGVLIVVEWAWERFDEATARWSFARLAAIDGNRDPNWLSRHQDHWMASQQPWSSYIGTWAQSERLHNGEDIVRALQSQFDTRLLTEAPYVFAELEAITPADEQAAINAGEIQPTGIRYVGRPKSISN